MYKKLTLDPTPEVAHEDNLRRQREFREELQRLIQRRSAEQDAELKVLQKKIAEQNRMIAEKDRMIAEKDRMIAEKTTELEALKKINAEITAKIEVFKKAQI
jgi:septal ring factor EnvC (AmiA/AmiB activator)